MYRKDSGEWRCEVPLSAGAGRCRRSGRRGDRRGDGAHPRMSTTRVEERLAYIYRCGVSGFRFRFPPLLTRNPRACTSARAPGCGANVAVRTSLWLRAGKSWQAVASLSHCMYEDEHSTPSSLVRTGCSNDPCTHGAPRSLNTAKHTNTSVDFQEEEEGGKGGVRPETGHTSRLSAVFAKAMTHAINSQRPTGTALVHARGERCERERCEHHPCQASLPISTAGLEPAAKAARKRTGTAHWALTCGWRD